MQSIDLNKDILWTKWIEVAGLSLKTANFLNIWTLYNVNFPAIKQFQNKVLSSTRKVFISTGLFASVLE